MSNQQNTYRALFAFTAQSSSELTLQADEILYIPSSKSSDTENEDNDLDSDSEWLLVENSQGMIGFVPRGYVQIVYTGVRGAKRDNVNTNAYVKESGLDSSQKQTFGRANSNSSNAPLHDNYNDELNLIADTKPEHKRNERQHRLQQQSRKNNTPANKNDFDNTSNSDTLKLSNITSNSTESNTNSNVNAKSRPSLSLYFSPTLDEGVFDGFSTRTNSTADIDIDVNVVGAKDRAILNLKNTSNESNDNNDFNSSGYLRRQSDANYSGKFVFDYTDADADADTNADPEFGVVNDGGSDEDERENEDTVNSRTKTTRINDVFREVVIEETGDHGMITPPSSPPQSQSQARVRTSSNNDDDDDLLTSLDRALGVNVEVITESGSKNDFNSSGYLRRQSEIDYSLADLAGNSHGENDRVSPTKQEIDVVSREDIIENEDSDVEGMTTPPTTPSQTNNKNEALSNSNTNDFNSSGYLRRQSNADYSLVTLADLAGSGSGENGRVSPTKQEIDVVFREVIIEDKDGNRNGMTTPPNNSDTDYDDTNTNTDDFNSSGYLRRLSNANYSFSNVNVDVDRGIDNNQTPPPSFSSTPTLTTTLTSTITTASMSMNSTKDALKTPSASNSTTISSNASTMNKNNIFSVIKAKQIRQLERDRDRNRDRGSKSPNTSSSTTMLNLIETINAKTSQTILSSNKSCYDDIKRKNNDDYKALNLMIETLKGRIDECVRKGEGVIDVVKGVVI